ncbi:MAG: superoxide dismutase [Cytophagales bacterium]|nr:superoxide dismutase [Cytophagales bacterium]MDW8383485.1 superoxide dismutase [Flammeovirgaceae bacterium]
MNRKTFLKLSTTATAGILLGCSPKNSPKSSSVSSGSTHSLSPVEFSLPPLPYPSNALEPFIDQLTMEIHHGKHHGGYVNNLNQGVKADEKFYGKELEELLAFIEPSDTTVRNNGGGHYNHSLFWKLLKPNGGDPYGKIADALNAQFGSYETFKEQFDKAAKSVFGSGWAWLIRTSENKLVITTTPNQDNPLMKKIVPASSQGKPVLAIDVWEHAYYLKYQNRRNEYISAFFNIINWDEVNARLG